MTTVYVVAGDPDRRLSGDEWRDYTSAVHRAIDEHAARIHGTWQSAPGDAWPSKAIAFRIADEQMPALRAALAAVRASYGLRSIVWAVADTHLYL